MDTNVNYTAVGLFVVILVSAIVMSIIWLSAGFSLKHYSTYLVFMQESVTGLSIDSPVEYNGVNVGSVTSINISQKNPNLVELHLSIRDDTPITQGTVASMGTRGLTGVAFIMLKDNGLNRQPLQIEPGYRYAVIKTTPSLFLRLDMALSKLNDSLSKTGNAIRSVLDPENQMAIKQTLINLRNLTGNLSAQTQKLDVILKNTAEASKQFSPLLQQGSSTIRIFETQTLPAVTRAMTTFDAISQNLYDISNQLRQNPSILIRGKTTGTLGPGEK